MRAKLTGVVAKVTRVPWAARSRARSTMGIMWPCAIRGTRRKWRDFVFEPQSSASELMVGDAYEADEGEDDMLWYLVVGN
ncbi:hypothetical protein M5K25_010349 [Dendrobium thyrsiflorum]|uniref:Uncharacterized protein n=1 Tax=Dendrobium thyrsiflorum TaxID=117978 RepID=A0ABD0V074_DENTH